MRAGCAAALLALLVLVSGLPAKALHQDSVLSMGLWSKTKSFRKGDAVDAGGKEANSGAHSPADTAENGISDAGFPQQQRFWQGGEYELLGSGYRYFKLGFIHVKVYSLALYVERQPAAAELARLKSEGFFKDGDYSVERMCSAIAALKCNKVAQIQLLRSVSASQFTGALAESLRPRLADSDDKRYIPAFEKYFETRSLSTSTNVLLLWTVGGQLEADLLPPGATDFASVTPGYTVPSPRFPSALFDIWLRADSPVTGAREQWAASLQAMLDRAAAK